MGELVEGVTKLTSLEDTSRELKQAENFRKLLLALSRDIRCCWPSRLLAGQYANSPSSPATAALAHRHRNAGDLRPAGRADWHDRPQEELEDLAFLELMPEARESIMQRTAFLREAGDAVTVDIIQQLRQDMKERG